MFGVFSYESFLNRGFSHLQVFTNPHSRLFWGYILCALLLAVAAYFNLRRVRDPEARPEKVEKGLFAFLFDRSVFLHRSAVQDYIYFAVNVTIYGGIISQLLIGAKFFFMFYNFLLVHSFGTPDAPLFAAGPVSTVLYTAAVILLIDFGVFITHYYQHKIAPLWEFHKVHHSAEVLTPITFARMHPVDLFFTSVTTVALSSLAMAVFAYLTGSIIQPITVVNLNIVTFVFYVLGYHLRHSHVWLSYPAWLSHILISPAQHQVHHSVDGKHWDKNLGLIFAVWDWMFGTLYVPKGYEKITFGVSRDEPNPFPNVLSMYLKPFRKAWQVLTPADGRLLRRFAVGAWVVIGATVYYGVYTISVADRAYTPPSLFMQDLTWPEIQRAMAAGYTRVIVPTAGIEQNGVHEILGKHVYIVTETARRIAEEVGDTLIAPTMPFAPEGPGGAHPFGHMRFPGTVSMPIPVFEAVLSAEVDSYATHGFKMLFFIGDHGGNQRAQAAVAKKYQDAGSAIHVYQIGDYYNKNGQMEWLLKQGFTKEQIGRHAAIRDTSELMAVHPEGVLSPDKIVQPLSAPIGPGSHGDWKLATPEIGRKMIDLKVAAAVRQINRIIDAEQKTVSLGN